MWHQVYRAGIIRKKINKRECAFSKRHDQAKSRHKLRAYNQAVPNNQPPHQKFKEAEVYDSPLQPACCLEN